MHLSTLAMLFAAVAAPVFSSPTSSTCMQYSCTSAARTLACCTGGGVISTKSGCEAYTNAQATGTCDPSQIYCCSGVNTITGAGTDCGPATATTVKCPA